MAKNQEENRPPCAGTSLLGVTLGGSPHSQDIRKETALKLGPGSSRLVRLKNPKPQQPKEGHSVFSSLQPGGLSDSTVMIPLGQGSSSVSINDAHNDSP